MPTYAVCYDLIKQGQNYTALTKKLEEYGTYWHAQGSVWLIHTSQTTVEIRDNLRSCLDQNDKIFVSRLTAEAAWAGYPQKITEWLKDVLNRA